MPRASLWRKLKFPRPAILLHHVFLGTAVLAVSFAALACALASRAVPSLEPSAFVRPGFEPKAYLGDPKDLPREILLRGSYIKGDDYRGEFVTGWYVASGSTTVFVAGAPQAEGNYLRIETRDQAGRIRLIPFRGPNPFEQWRRWDLEFASDVGSFRIRAHDGSAAFRGWLAVSEPVRLVRLPSLRWVSRDVRMLLCVGLEESLLFILGLASIRMASRFMMGETGTSLLVGLAITALTAFAAFWIYFFSPAAGRLFSWLVVTGTIAFTLSEARKRHLAPGERVLCRIFGLCLMIALAYASFTLLFGQRAFSDLAGSRFRPGMLADNLIPQLFADRLWEGESPRQLVGDWLSSDRPPLQSGWILLFRPIFDRLGADNDTLASAAGLSFQLLWVPVLWLLVRRLGAGPRLASASVAAMALTGVGLFHSVYVWPKYGAAALVCGGFLLWLPGTNPSLRPLRFVFAGICVGLGWVSHGSVGFSLVGFIPIFIWLLVQGEGRPKEWLGSLVAFGLIAGSWLCYQRFYEPPGDRLLKWHLAGAVDVNDHRSFLTCLIQGYRELGWVGAWQQRWSNLRMQVWGDWGRFLRFAPPARIDDRRWDETEYALRGFGWWLAVVPVLLVSGFSQSVRLTRVHLATIGWWLCGWLASLGLLFQGNQATVHQGTMVTQIVGFGLLCCAAARLGRWLFLGTAILQGFSFFLDWTAPTRFAQGPIDFGCIGVGAVTFGLLVAQIVSYAVHRERFHQERRIRG